ncbi:kinase-like protein [Zopfia rhizophila CBS 207.26]|uniref:Kinase-like protein n=1 Tax=Zopfia rhizophila CBS 207.26 TaxID=1314779 RepID=A0A6A6DIM8_9PEZI|nr:kinase-like protein [Zopfia rhizophila CBS 207.26]
MYDQERVRLGLIPNKACKKSFTRHLGVTKAIFGNERRRFDSLIEVMTEFSLALSIASKLISNILINYAYADSLMQQFLLNDVAERPLDALASNFATDDNVLVTKSAIAPGCSLHEFQIDIIPCLRHPHIVKVHCSYVTPTFWAIVLSPVADGDLGAVLEEWGHKELWVEAKNRIIPWISYLSSALAYMHSKRIKYKDIKLSNILYRDTNIFITDFGLSAHFGSDCSSTSDRPGGSHLYAAPEFKVDGRRGCSADVFSMGYVFLEMCCLQSTSRSNNSIMLGATKIEETPTMRRCTK